MRELRFSAISEDAEHLVVTRPGGPDEDSEEFLLACTPQLRAAIDQVLGVEQTSDPGRQILQLSVREIQSRVRFGASIDEVAAAAGVPVGRIEAYALPILAERSSIAERAAKATLHTETATQPLASALAEALATRHIDPSALAWDAFRLDGGGWQVVLALPEGAHPRRAVFHFDPRADRITPADDAAAVLVDPSVYVPLHSVPRPAAPSHAPDTEEARPKKSGRRPVPSWADILITTTDPPATPDDDRE